MSQTYGSVPTTTSSDVVKDVNDNDNDDIQFSTVVPTPKRGHICCGGCCDVRRATIIVDIIEIVLIVYSIITVAKIKEYAAKDEFDDDYVEDKALKFPAYVWYIQYVIAIGLLCIAIRGAQTYNNKYVFVGFFLYCFWAVMDLFTLNLLNMVVNLCFAYPHYFLFNEIQKGIMTPETYATSEKHSCCCV